MFEAPIGYVLVTWLLLIYPNQPKLER